MKSEAVNKVKGGFLMGIGIAVASLVVAYVANRWVIPALSRVAPAAA